MMLPRAFAGLWLLMVACLSGVAGATLDGMWGVRCVEGQVPYSTEFATFAQRFGYRMPAPAVAVVNNRTTRVDGYLVFDGMTTYCEGTHGTAGIAVLYPNAIADSCDVKPGGLECGAWRVRCRRHNSMQGTEGTDASPPH